MLVELISGLVCCDGYLLNQTTGQCQRCPLGYFLNNCSKKCSPPNYGEECQYVCRCPYQDCHFATGCPQRLETFTVYQHLSSTRRDTSRQTTFFMTVTTTQLFYGNESHIFSADVGNNVVTRMPYVPTETDLFKNDFVVRIFQIIVSFIGVFVIFFSIFVISYIYMKCFRKTTNEVEINERKEAQYTALSVSAVEPENETQQAYRQQENTNCTYLTAVFKDRAHNETCHSGENVRIFQETSFKRQQNRQKPADESNFTPDAGSTNVYIEII